MGIKIYHLYTTFGLEPGDSTPIGWDCPAVMTEFLEPTEVKAYVMDVRPIPEFRLDPQAQLEITKTFRKVRINSANHSKRSETERVSGYIKNIGEATIGYAVYLIAIDNS